MKKLLEKDKKRRQKIIFTETKTFILKSIINNLNYFDLLRWNASLKLKKLIQTNSKTSLTSRCLFTINKKRFNKLTGFSRQVFLKKIRSGVVTGIKKSSW